MPQQRPHDARHLGRQGQHGRVGVGSGQEPAQLGADPGLAGLQGRQGGPRSLDQHLAQVLAPAFRDAEELGPAAGRFLPRHQPSACCPTMLRIA